jgi:segregation and condensation protein B
MSSHQQQALPLKSLVESLLFVADEPVSVDKLAAVLEATPDRVNGVLSELAAEYEGRGVRLQRKGHSVQIVSAPEAAEFVRRLLGIDSGARLSPAALETLAIIAYRQPVTRGQIQAVRGVDSDSVLRTLLTQGLIEEQGRLEQVGRPIVYGTTFDFLQHFGLRDLEQLPPLDVQDRNAGEHGGSKGDTP